MLFVKIIMIVLGILLFAVDIYLFIVSLEFRSSKCCKCKGYLQNQRHLKNKKVHRGRYRDPVIWKDYLEFSYVYRVENKEYTINYHKNGKYGDIPNIVTVHYSKNKPESAYIPNLTFLVEPLLCGLLFPFWVLLIVCGIMV